MGQDGNPEKPASAASSVSRLKELLFDDEAAKLSGLTQRIDQVYERAGNDDQLRSSVARVLDGVLVDAEKSRHDQVTRALAPMVVKTVQTELVNSQDALVEALYPVTGRMVQAYVASAMKDLANEINAKIENNSAMLRIRSVFTGRPVAELAISDSQRLTVSEILLIRRGTGELLEHWPDNQELSNSNIHLSGILTAINDFAAHAFEDNGGTIRDFSVDDFSMFLRASPNYLLAAKCTGTSASGIQYIIDGEFLGLLERIDEKQPANSTEHVSDPALLAAAKENLDARIKARFDEITAPLPVSPLKVIGALLLLLLIAGLSWWAFTSIEKARTHSTTAKIIATTPGIKADYVDVKVGYRGRSVQLSGISPSKNATETLSSSLREKLPDVTLSNRLLSMPAGSADAEREIALLRARLRKELARVEIGVDLSALLRAIKRSRIRLDAALTSLAQINRRPQDETPKNETAKARALIEQSTRELASYQSAVEAAPRENGALKNLDQPLAALSNRLTSATAILTKLLGTSPPAANTAESTKGVVNSAERASAEADQIAALTLALSTRAPAQTPRQKLQAWIANNAIFFANGAELRSSITAASKLDTLAALILADDGLVRVVGYTDERGSPSRNDSLALSRAERVSAELTRRGAPAARLLTIGRAAGPDLSPHTGTDSPNRRVEFEIGFIGEKGP